ncbi:MAG TPA: hypothetical protein VKU36_01950 [Candidatus Babeliales bacterium]|nr:hypothetical protein [Candidatus Babeliales bacterium]
MHKNFLVIALFTTSSLISMELATKEKQKFVVALDLREVKKEDLQDIWNKLHDKGDAHGCKVLGITWEENNNTYFTYEAGIRKFDETKYINSWKDNYINVIPKSTIRNEDEEEKYQYSVKFPKSLPASFVERLEKEKSITLENTHFAEPVEIIVTLRMLKKLKKQTEESSSSES